MRTSEILNCAADLIEEHGWGTGTWATTGPLCIEGGIIAALGYRGFWDADFKIAELWTCPAYSAVMAHLGHDATRRETFPQGPTEPLYEFNDAPGRTAAEVIEVLRAAAVIEAAKETVTLVPIPLPQVDGLTMDDLESLAFKYGGTVERNPHTNRCTLVGAVIDGRVVKQLGPVAMGEVV